MMSTTITCNRVRAWLKSKWQVTVPDDWLMACVEWIDSENQDLPLGNSNFNQMVYEQWLVSDLRELNAATLPPSLAEQPKVILNGRYCLQVNSLVDVSIPFYGQLTKIRGKENENVNINASTQLSQPAWEVKPSRMLMMTLTDGVQDVQGMEYRQIPSINPALPAGTKVLVQGEVVCRLGVLMLCPENFSVLGGEVDSLMNENNPEINLQRELDRNRQLGQTHTARKEFAVSAKRQSHAMTNQQNARLQQPEGGGRSLSNTSNKANTSRRISLDEWGDDDLVMLDSVEQFNMNNSKSRNAEDDFELMMNDDLDDALLASSQMPEEDDDDSAFETSSAQIRPNQWTSRINQKQQSAASNNYATSHTNKPMRMGSSSGEKHRKPSSTVLPWKIDAPISSHIAKAEKRERIVSSSHIAGDNKPMALSMGFTADDDKKILPEVKPEPLDLHSHPFTYLFKVQESWPPCRTTVVTVKAYVATVLGKLESNEGKHWSLLAKINDGSAAMDVILSDEILKGLIGFSAKESAEMRLQARHDKAIKHRLLMGFKLCQENLINLSAIMDIELNPKQAAPIVLRQRQVTAADCDALRDRNR